MAFFPRCSNILLIVIGLASFLSPDPVWAASQEPVLINQIVINPRDPNIVYAAVRPQGVLKSTDRGMSWRPARNGLMNTSVYHIVIHPKDPNILYLGTFGGGVYKTENGGENWFEVNQGLGNTNIHALALNPLNPEQLIVSTSTGELFKSDDGGKSWNPFNEGLPFFPGDVIATLLIFPKVPEEFILGQGGLFTRPFSSTAWHDVNSSLHDQVITALAYDRLSRTFYAGTIKEGLFKTSLSPNSLSVQPPLNWKSVGGPFQKQWVHLIVLDPSNSSVIYAGIMNQGLLKSTDHGATWTEINTGLPTKEVESLAIDTENPKRLYAGTHNDGLFVSRDGGQTWHPPAKLEVEPVKQLIDSLPTRSYSSLSQEPRLVPPPSFAKCNKCHGWTDTALNQKTTYWRVSPNRRDWQPTVRRMSTGAGLTPEETEVITRFLTEYSRQRSEMH